jgi:hypothetical protein
MTNVENIYANEQSTEQKLESNDKKSSLQFLHLGTYFKKYNNNQVFS